MWPETGRPRRAGVSSFGVSGTNAHVIIEQAPADPADVAAATATATATATAIEDARVPLVLSAASPTALGDQARRLERFLADRPEITLPEVGRALAQGRARLSHRGAVVAGSRDDALTALRALSDGLPDPAVLSGIADVGGTAGPVFVFPGQGAQWVGMGAGLLGGSSWLSEVFRGVVEEVSGVLAGLVDWSLVDVLRGVGSDGVLERVEVVQPASFAVGLGLVRVWGELGVVPGAVLGHSQGEVVAACVAGALGVGDAVRVVVGRSRVVAERLSGRGGMVSVFLPVDEVVGLLPVGVEVAAVNGPGVTVVSGERAGLVELVGVLEGRGVRVRWVAVDYASHSSQVDGVAGELRELLAGVRSVVPRVPFFSTVEGRWVSGAGELEGD
ncbi:acyltransferase domain-containing protein [Frankia sp. Mgl5]|nr:acyltransferase domain-containing protein [Frankia sp. Mgl5]